MITTHDKLKQAWPSFSEVLRVPHSEKEYKSLVKLLDSLIDDERVPELGRKR